MSAPRDPEPIDERVRWHIGHEESANPSSADGTLAEIEASRDTARASPKASNAGETDLDRVASVLVGIAMRLLDKGTHDSGGDRC